MSRHGRRSKNSHPLARGQNLGPRSSRPPRRNDEAAQLCAVESSAARTYQKAAKQRPLLFPPLAWLFPLRLMVWTAYAQREESWSLFVSSIGESSKRRRAFLVPRCCPKKFTLQVSCRPNTTSFLLWTFSSYNKRRTSETQAKTTSSSIVHPYSKQEQGRRPEGIRNTDRRSKNSRET